MHHLAKRFVLFRHPLRRSRVSVGPDQSQAARIGNCIAESRLPLIASLQARLITVHLQTARRQFGFELSRPRFVLPAVRDEDVVTHAAEPKNAAIIASENGEKLSGSSKR